MHVSEFGLFLLWQLILPFAVGIALLRLCLSWDSPARKGRFVGAAAILIMVAITIAWVLVSLGPAWLGPYLGVQNLTVGGLDIAWAPFAFIAVVLAFPVAAWWGTRDRRQENP